MLIKVNKTQKAASCPMGVKTKIYEAQEEPQEIYDDLAKVFIKERWGVIANEPIAKEKMLGEIGNKAIRKSPNNKSFADNKNINNKKGK